MNLCARQHTRLFGGPASRRVGQIDWKIPIGGFTQHGLPCKVSQAVEGEFLGPSGVILGGAFWASKIIKLCQLLGVGGCGHLWTGEARSSRVFC